MKISTRGRYALRVMIDLAEKEAENDTENKSNLIKLKDIAKRQEISKDYIVHLLIALKNAGLVRSSSGKNGGYSLAHSPEEIQILDIVEATIGRIYILDCLSDDTLCHRAKDCKSRNVWSIVNSKIKDTLSSITLAQISDSKCDIDMLIMGDNDLISPDASIVCGQKE